MMYMPFALQPDNKHDVLQSLMLHDILVKRKSILDQFRKGLSTHKWAAKKGASQPAITPKPGHKRSIASLKQAGPDRTKLTLAMDGHPYYKCRGPFLHYFYGELNAMDTIGY